MERTFKCAGWQPQTRPIEGKELEDSRQLIRETVFALFFKKKKMLDEMQMPAQPVTLNEIYLEICSRVQINRSCRRWPYPHHEKRWWDRRVNEAACASYCSDGVPKVVAATAGRYMPNPELFEKPILQGVQR